VCVGKRVRIFEQCVRPFSFSIYETERVSIKFGAVDLKMYTSI
jgi:hypothetical protein